MKSFNEFLTEKRAEQVAKENEAFHQLFKLLGKKITAEEQNEIIQIWVNGVQASEWVGWYDRAIIDQEEKEKVAN